MTLYGLIGKPLGHSFSQKYFTDFFEGNGISAAYRPFELSVIDDFPALIASQPLLAGLNVTLPYKQMVMQWLDEVDEGARAIGAVNVIRIQRVASSEAARCGVAGVRLTGYNTDAIGFRDSLVPLLRPHHRRALVLGTGGASKAVYYVLRQLDIEVTIVSRTPCQGQKGYDELDEETMAAHTLIVNATPVGTYPKTDECPALPYRLLTPSHLCYDLVYNPSQTLFLQTAAAHGAVTKNGLEMLHRQADAAWKIWNE